MFFRILGYVLLGLLILLVAALLIPLQVRVQADPDSQRVELHYLFLRFPLYPGKEAKEAEELEEDELAAAAGKKGGRGGDGGKKKMDLGFILDMLGSTLHGLRFLTRHIHLRRVELYARVGAEEPDRTAVLYGQINAVLWPVLGLVSSVFYTRYRRVELEPDFAEEGFFFKVGFRLWALPVILLVTAAVVAVRLLKNMRQRRQAAPEIKREPDSRPAQR